MLRDPMVWLLGGIGLVIAWSFYRMHQNPSVDFNALDLILENGRVSKIACTFLAAFGVTSWIMVKLTIDGKMNEGLFTAYGLMWVAPLVSKVVFNKSSVTEPKP